MPDETHTGAGDPQTKSSSAVMPAPAKPRHLPMFKVILHNDDQNSMKHVINSIVELTPLNAEDALDRAHEADSSGCSLLLVIHRERAELYEEQFRSKSLTVMIEPAD